MAKCNCNISNNHEQLKSNDNIISNNFDNFKD